MTDPHPNPRRFIGRRASFDHNGRRLQGVVIEQTYIGPSPRGAIPDYRLRIRGDSGRELEVSMWETYASIHD